MGLGRLAVLALASLAMAEDLLFYDGMLYQEYTQATTVLGLTGIVMSFIHAMYAPYKQDSADEK